MARLIDVILPVYNAASTVREAISSLQQQTVKDIRIIIVDDGSTDQTPHILTEIANCDDRITLLRKSNSGIVEALNAGLELSRADFIARQDADDISNSTRFRGATRSLSKKSGLYGRIRSCPAYRSTWPIYGEDLKVPPFGRSRPILGASPRTLSHPSVFACPPLRHRRRWWI